MRLEFVIATGLCLAGGCTGFESSTSTDPTTEAGAINVIRMGIEDLEADVNRADYRGDGLGSDSLANTIVRFSDASTGTDIETEAHLLKEHFFELEGLIASGANIADVKAKVQTLKGLVAAIQEKR